LTSSKSASASLCFPAVVHRWKTSLRFAVSPLRFKPASLGFESVSSSAVRKVHLLVL